jgi:cystathionine gamma-synthase
VVLQPVDVTDTDAVINALPSTDLLWLESPTNPMLGVVELPPILAAARDADVMAVVDNTFATPLAQRPLDWGASATIHSATKYIGGHSDLLLGVVVTTDEDRRAALHNHRTLHGTIPGVMETFLALRGLRTLPLRFAQQQQTARQLAERLSDHSRVIRVRYPGLPNDPHHDRAQTHMNGFGAIVSFEVQHADAADRIVRALKLIVGGTSLGGVETTIDRRQRWPGEENVPAGLLRLSVGLEHLEDLWDDLERAIGSSTSAFQVP